MLAPLPWPLRGGDAGNSLQVGGDLDVLPRWFFLHSFLRSPFWSGFQKITHAFGDGAADFHDQPPARLERSVRGGDQLLNDFQACGSGEDGVTRLEFPHFKLDCVFLGFPDIRWI